MNRPRLVLTELREYRSKRTGNTYFSGYRFEFTGQIPALAWVGDAGFDELAVHVALWPTAEAERWVRVNNAGRMAGEVWATGWLKRRKRPYLQSTANLFTGAKLRISLIAGVAIEPRDGAYADRGILQF